MDKARSEQQTRANYQIEDLFTFYDQDKNGVIQRHELIEVLSLCASEIGLDVQNYLEQIADAIFADTQDDSITFEALREVLRKRPNLTNELSLAIQARRLSQPTAAMATAASAATTAATAEATSTTGQQQQQHLQRAHQRPGAAPRCAWDGLIDVAAARLPVLNKLRWEYINNNLVRFGFFLGLVLVQLLLVVSRAHAYWGSCGFLVVARCAGQCLNCLCSIIVLLVCRRTISSLRAHGYGRYLPLDDNVYFHKMVGLFVGFWSLVHTCGHLLNFAQLVGTPGNKFTYAQYLFGLEPGIGWVGGSACLTGWLLLVILAIMSLAQPFSRSLGKFELFYYTHLLYIPFWALLVVHAPHFWIWFLGPFLIFLYEALVRLRNFLTNLTASGKTQIIKAVPLPSDVIHLVIKRPANFEYNPGDWIYVLIPQIAKYEWHPFTISSAPEQDGVIWLHIRAVGEWTRCLRSYFENMENRNHLSHFIKSGHFALSMEQFNNQGDLDVTRDSARTLGAQRSMRAKPSLRSSLKNQSQTLALSPIPENNTVESIELSKTAQTTTTSCGDGSGSSSSGADSFSSANSSASQDSLTTSQRMARSYQLPNITIFIDGPYGSPSSQIFRSEHAVLIATGIGVTPFASILQSIVKHYEKRRQKCPSCAHEFSDQRLPLVCKLRKVDFVWINRSQKSFEWFIKLLAELELTQSHLAPSERFLDIHIHLTAMEPAKINSIGLQLALYLAHEKNKKDLVTGLTTRTKAGRPNWEDFFDNIQQQKKGKVSVFFCGRPQLGRALHRQCDRFGFKFRKEIF